MVVKLGLHLANSKTKQKSLPKHKQNFIREFLVRLLKRALKSTSKEWLEKVEVFWKWDISKEGNIKESSGYRIPSVSLYLSFLIRRLFSYVLLFYKRYVLGMLYVLLLYMVYWNYKKRQKWLSFRTLSGPNISLRSQGRNGLRMGLWLRIRFYN